MIVIDARTLIGAYERDIVLIYEWMTDEIQDVLARPKFADVPTLQRQAETVLLLIGNVHWFVPQVRLLDCRDPCDNIYRELALAANATALVPSDKDLPVPHQWRGIPIFPATEFLGTL